MSKYNIISKSFKGNIENKTCVIEYQVDGYGAERFTTSLVYIELKDKAGPRYVWLADGMGKHIDTEEDKKNFLNEFEQYQKGGSYRKTHPIIYTEIENLKREKQKLQSRLTSVESDIRRAEDAVRRKKFSNYTDDIDYDTLDKYIEGFTETFKPNDRYYIDIIQHMWDGIKFMVMDKKLNKAVKVGMYDADTGIKFRNLYDYEIKI